MDKRIQSNIERLDQLARSGKLPGIDSVEYVGFFGREIIPQPLSIKPQPKKAQIDWAKTKSWLKKNNSAIRFWITTLIGLLGIIS